MASSPGAHYWSLPTPSLPCTCQCSVFSSFVWSHYVCLSFFVPMFSFSHLRQWHDKKGEDMISWRQHKHIEPHIFYSMWSVTPIVDWALYCTWQLPEELCEQEGHQSLLNDHLTSQPLFSFMCHIQLTVRLVCSLSHSLNPSLCCSQSCRVAPFHLPWLLAMAIFCPGSLDPSW